MVVDVRGREFGRWIVRYDLVRASEEVSENMPARTFEFCNRFFHGDHHAPSPHEAELDGKRLVLTLRKPGDRGGTYKSQLTMGRVAFLLTIFVLGFLINSLLHGRLLLLTTNSYYAPPAPSSERRGRSDPSGMSFNASASPVKPTGRGWNRMYASSPLFTDKCFYVEDICRSSHRWFYRPPSSNKIDEDGSGRKRQPDVLLMKEYKSFREVVINPSYRHSYRFETNVSSMTASDWERCVDSPIENHLVMFSAYNEMLGEFYDKALMFLWLLSRDNDWVRSAQLYLHMYMPFRRLLDSHHLFTAPFRTNPLLDFTSLLDEPSCTCLPRLILCGYEVIHEPQRRPANSSSDPSSDGAAADAAAESLSSDGPALTVLEPGRSLWRKSDNLHPNPDDMFRDLRTHLRQSIIESNRGMRQDIRAHREGILSGRKIPESEWAEWKVVGLAQRSGRRRWRDLPKVRSEAQRVLHSNKVVLVEVNVEARTSTPYQQVVWHGALDALVGIHGAQLTEAIWMRPGAWVVEFLPYNPKGLYMGHWVTYTDRPTPLGECFHRTDLNLASFPLQRDSAPYCYDDNPQDHPEDPLLCWRLKNNPWDERDFVLDAAALVGILNRTVLVESPHSLCRDYPDSTGDRVVVLGNLNCALTRSDPVEPHHFHWINETSSDAAR